MADFVVHPLARGRLLVPETRRAREYAADVFAAFYTGLEDNYLLSRFAACCALRLLHRRKFTIERKV